MSDESTYEAFGEGEVFIPHHRVRRDETHGLKVDPVFREVLATKIRKEVDFEVGEFTFSNLSGTVRFNENGHGRVSEKSDCLCMFTSFSVCASNEEEARKRLEKVKEVYEEQEDEIFLDNEGFLDISEVNKKDGIYLLDVSFDGLEIGKHDIRHKNGYRLSEEFLSKWEETVEGVKEEVEFDVMKAYVNEVSFNNQLYKEGLGERNYQSLQEVEVELKADNQKEAKDRGTKVVKMMLEKMYDEDDDSIMNGILDDPSEVDYEVQYVNKLL